MHMLMQVNEFSYGPVTPALGFAMSFLGAFLGLRCAARARANDSWGRRGWLVLAGVSLGLSCVWVGHFIEMLGFAAPGRTVLYDVPETLASAFLAVAAMCAGLFILTWLTMREFRMAQGCDLRFRGFRCSELRTSPGS